MEKTKKSLKKQSSAKILEIFEKGVQEIENKNPSEALSQFLSCEEKLEKLVNKGFLIDINLIIATLHNISLCWQSLSKYTECSSYLEACIYNIKSKLNYFKSPDQGRVKNIRKARYLCLLHIQLSDCFSSLSNHTHAYTNAKKALKFSLLAIKLCLDSCSDQRLKTTTMPGTNKTMKNDLFLCSRYDIFQYLYLKVNGKKIGKNAQKLLIKTILEETPDWAFSTNFDRIFEIKTLRISDLKYTHNFKAELSSDFMLDKIFMAITSYYILFRELSMLDREPLLAEKYLKRAINIAGLLPNSLLCDYLTQAYTEKYKKKLKKNSSIRSKSAKNTAKIEPKLEKKN